MITLSVRGLPRNTTEESLTALFSQYGVVRSLKLVKDLFSGECRGFATIDMEGHEARAAMSALDGSEFQGGQIRVGPDRPRLKRGGGGRRRR
jgi:RNA recognition motif-containing protein